VGVAAACAALAWVTAIACGGGDDAAHVGLDVDQGCLINSDCRSPLVCAFRKCHQQCKTQVDCMHVQRCVASDKPYHVCQLPDEAACTLNSQCDGQEVCGVDGQCRDQCAADRDCTGGQTCVLETCAIPTELTEAGTLPVTQMTPEPGAPCSYDSQCQPPLVCRSGTCEWQCRTSRDCAAGYACIGQVCTPPATPPDGGAPDGAAGDSGSSGDGPGPTDAPPDGKVGLTCKADSDCQDGLACNGEERCIGAGDGGSGYCAPAVQGLCDTTDPCVFASCVEPGNCAYTPSDSDHDKDGHYKVGALCNDGEPADDCDDDNPNVYLNHPELCDQIDNNCNGIVDETVWGVPATIASLTSADAGAPFPVSSTTANGTVAYFQGPSVARFDDGTFAIVGAGDESSGAITAWHVDATVHVIDGAPLAASPGADCLGAHRLLGSTVATDGANLIATSMFVNPHGATSCCIPHAGGLYEADSVVAMAPESLAGPTSFTLQAEGPPGGTAVCSMPFDWSFARPARAVWVKSKNAYAIAWADSHLVSDWSQIVVNVAWLDPAGRVTGEHTVLPLATQARTSLAFTDVLIASDDPVSPTSFMVAFASYAKQEVEAVLLDPATLTVIGGPVDVGPPPNEVYPGSLVYTGKAYMLATSDESQNITLTRFDHGTGAVINQRSITVPASSPAELQPRLAVVGTGVVLTYTQTNGFAYFWTPEALPTLASGAGAFQATQVPLGAPVTGIAVAAVDAQHVVATWADGNMKAAVLSCAP
jgi:hypothetical protein